MRATCHCTSISVDVPAPVSPLNECQCTVCYRYGAIWAYYASNEANITRAEGQSIAAASTILTKRVFTENC